MKIGIGIDTGGTCTDAIIYNFEEKKVLAFAKATTTREDLSIGIEEAISKLPKDLRSQVELIALSTTLATNACVENKGGRGKLFFFGANKDVIIKTGKEYGLSEKENLVFIDSKTNPNGFIEKHPDWVAFKNTIKEELKDCDAAGVVEFFAKKTGAVIEKKAREVIKESFDIPVICGHELFDDYNIIKRGASTLLNARLLTTIDEFMAAVKAAMKKLDLNVPFVIVRSDGSLMNESFARLNPVETLLCGPVASVMGASELTQEHDSLIVDIGGTTTDVAFVKNGIAKQAENGIHIGEWDTFVKGLFVDTFGLGGDSLVTVDEASKMQLSNQRAIPLCMIADRFPDVLPMLEESSHSVHYAFNQREEIYVSFKPVEDRSRYTERELEVCDALLNNPLTLGHLGATLDRHVSSESLHRLVSEGAIMRCGVTPTDAMHILGDFTAYNKEASRLGIYRLSRMTGMDTEGFARLIYKSVEKKLYVNLARILIENRYPEWRTTELPAQFIQILGDNYEKEFDDFMDFSIKTNVTLIGVGAPTHVFLPNVAKKLGAKFILPEYASVANALGAIVGNVVTRITMEVSPDAFGSDFLVFGKGEREKFTYLGDAKETAKRLAEEKAREEMIKRGASDNIEITFEEEENFVDTAHGTAFVNYVVTAIAKGDFDITTI